MHIHAQSTVELDREDVRVFRGPDQHVAITNSITTSSAIVILLVYVRSYQDGDREFS